LGKILGKNKYLMGILYRCKINTELINYASYATAEELDEMLKVYRYDGLSAGVRCDAISG
jgi:hypothetical protein